METLCSVTNEGRETYPRGFCMGGKAAQDSGHIAKRMTADSLAELEDIAVQHTLTISYIEH